MKLESRAHALFMAVVNLSTALLFLLMTQVNASAGYPSTLVTILGPLGVAGFGLWTCTWVHALWKSARSIREHLQSLHDAETSIPRRM